MPGDAEIFFLSMMATGEPELTAPGNLRVTYSGVGNPIYVWWDDVPGATSYQERHRTLPHDFEPWGTRTSGAIIYSSFYDDGTRSEVQVRAVRNGEYGPVASLIIDS